ncbi:MAG: rRNA pseudouridine synthase [SAR86 cluster bacterium]|uniref:Pseudouridine synthase n=1 Tax=SAR86 cluster bacterium TaxID=2030880 RepID=A0A520MTG4_9GAMM|nr:MAG: rRNA pseudouridine synthase [SAR86 cluster bacterium]
MIQLSTKLQHNKEKISKYLANLGFASRRNITDLFKTKKITLNNKTINHNALVEDNDVINIDGEDFVVEINPETEVLIYHKPTGQVCSNVPTDKNDSVFQALPPRKKGKWIMVGRLDVNTSGLLVFSNNGDFVNQLTHPSSKIDREYLCRVYGDISDNKLENIMKGVNINGEKSSFSDVVAVKKTTKSKNHWFYVCLFTGKNREVRKIWDTQKLTVNRLIRLRYGPIIMPDNLKPGGWKKFSKKEVTKLQDLLKIQ